MADLIVVKKRCTIESVSYLPLEIIFEILVRVSVESLIEYKFVCKSWYSIIKDPQFIEMQLIQSLHQKILHYVLFSKSNYNLITKHWSHRIYSVIEEEEYKWRAIEETNLFKERLALGISGSCNGLLCLSPTFDCLDPVFICNLITRECVKMPVTNQLVTVFSHILKKQVTISKTDVDVEGVFQEIGFGYDPLSKKYKLVRMIVMDFHNDDYSIGEIMTMGDGENIWRRIEFPYTLSISYQPETLVVESSVYWKIAEQQVGYSYLENILVMDLRDEKFQTIKYPPSLDINNTDSTQVLMNFGGLLALVDRGLLNTHVWTMVNNNWIRQYTFDLWSPRYINKYGGIVCGGKTLEPRRQLSYYDTTKRQTFPIQISGSPDCFQISSFVPSLISPKAIMAGNPH